MKKLFILAASLTLSACGPVYETHYTYSAPKSWRGRDCVNQCLNGKTQCKVNDDRQNQQCRNEADLAAGVSYYAYVEQQKRANQPVTQSLSDFANYSNCHANSDCNSSYNDCYANCGGKVTSYQVCTMFCPKPGQK